MEAATPRWKISQLRVQQAILAGAGHLPWQRNRKQGMNRALAEHCCPLIRVAPGGPIRLEI